MLENNNIIMLFMPFTGQFHKRTDICFFYKTAESLWYKIPDFKLCPKFQKYHMKKQVFLTGAQKKYYRIVDFK